MRVRQSARVILLDEADRVLLLKFEDMLFDGNPLIFRPGGQVHTISWATPGGKVEEGESPEGAACRELWEETGISLTDPGAFVAVCNPVLSWNGEIIQAHDRFYLTRITAPVIDPSRLTQDERVVYREHRWWSLGALRSTNEFILPTSLASLMVRILTEGLPSVPIELPD